MLRSRFGAAHKRQENGCKSLIPRPALTVDLSRRSGRDEAASAAAPGVADRLVEGTRRVPGVRACGRLLVCSHVLTSITSAVSGLCDEEKKQSSNTHTHPPGAWPLVQHVDPEERRRKVEQGGIAWQPSRETKHRVRVRGPAEATESGAQRPKGEEEKPDSFSICAVSIASQLITARWSREE